MSRETRTVRPFRTAALESALDGVRLRFGEEECEAAARILVDDPETFAISRGEIIWAPGNDFAAFKRTLTEGAERLGVDPSELGLLVTATTTFIRRTQIIFDCSLADLESLERVTLITPSERPAALRTGFHGAVVEAYVLLLRGLPKRPLQPWRKGTWLARARFTIEVDRGAELFRLTPLDDEKRAELDIPDKAMRWVDLDDYDPLEPLRDLGPPRFYVDETCLAHLRVRHSSPIGVALQAQLVHDFIAAVVWYSAVNASEQEVNAHSWDDIEDSLLGRVLRFAAGPRASVEDKQMLLKTACTKPEQVLAKVEHAIDIGKHFVASLGAES